jgi:hypothetical protein
LASCTPYSPRLVIPELDDLDVSAISIVMAALGGGHPGKHKVFQVDWMAGSSPAIQWNENSPMFSWLLLLAETSG